MQVKDNLVELEVVYSKLNKALDENISRLNAGATAVDNYNKKISVVPSEFQKSLTDIKVKTDAVTISAKKLEQQSIRESNARNALNKQREVTIKQLEREQAKLNASLSLQAKTTAQLKKVQFSYDELALKKQRYNNLSANEEKRLITLTSTLQKYRSIQDGVNTTVGKFQQRVGNYAGGFNPLSNSINQLSREMPAFANSVQTGFMAISNNLPIFFDAMENAISQQKELQKQGLPSKNALQLLAGSFFTLGTALSLGVTALTIFAPMLIKSITNSEQKTKAIEAEKKAREEQVQIEKQYADTLSKLASDEQAKSKIYLENAKNLNLPLKERIKNVELLQSRYPAYFGNLKQEEILAGNTAKAEYDLNNALMKRALFLAVQDKIKETTKELVDAEFKYLQTQQKQIDTNNLYDKSLQNTTKTKQKYRLVTEQEANSTEYLKKLEDDRNKSLQKGNVIQLSATDVLRKNTIVAKDKLDLLYRILNQNAKYNSVVREDTNETKKNTKTKEEQAKVVETFLLGSIGWYEQQIKLLKEQADVIKANSTVVLAENEAYNKQLSIIADYQLGLEKLLGVKKDLIDNEGIALDLGGSEFITDADGDRLMEEGDKLRELLKEFKQGFIDDFADQSGFGKFLDILGGGLDKFEGDAVATALAVTDAFQEAFNTIAEMSNANFQNEYNNLEKQKETAVYFANGNAETIAEIERQAEEKRRQIAEREFKAQKSQALFNIAVNTAQAVIGALATLPSPSAVPLSIAVGAIGLAQAGIVASREIPQYWTGTDNAKEGFALTQERGREIIMDRFGKIKDLGSDDGARLTKMKAGDKVLNNEKTMELLMFNSQFNSKLAPNLNTMPNLVVNNNTDFTPIIKAIQNKPETILNFDNGEFKKFVRNGNSIKETTQIRNGFKGLRV